MMKYAPAPLANRAPPTQDDIAAKRRMALSLMQQGSDTAPVGHWTQALARAFQGGIGGLTSAGAATDASAREAYDAQQSAAQRMAANEQEFQEKRRWDEYQRTREPTEAEKLELESKRAQIEKLRQPDRPSLPTGYRWSADGTQMEQIPGGPAAQPPKKSVTELKQIHAADDEVIGYQNSIDTLNKAKSLIVKDPNNPQGAANGPMAYEGMGSGWAGYIGSRVPGGSYLFDKDRAQATDEYGTIMNMEAIKAMSETLKGATTNFELQEFVRILADPSQPREIRERTINRMLSLLEKRKNLAGRRSEEIRSGDYYRPEAGGAGASGVIDLGGGFSVEVE